MKFLIILFFSFNSFAFDKKFVGNSSLLEDQVATYSHISDFLVKKKACIIAWDYPIADKAFDLFSRHNGYYNKVKCIQDLSFNKGTSKERFGCSFTTYDHTKDKYSSALAFSSKKCLEGGLEELASQKHYCLYDYISNNIYECMFPVFNSDKNYISTLLYSESNKTTLWYSRELTKQTNKVKEKKEKEKKYIEEYNKKKKIKEDKRAEKEKKAREKLNIQKLKKEKADKQFNELFK